MLLYRFQYIVLEGVWISENIFLSLLLLFYFLVFFLPVPGRSPLVAPGTLSSEKDIQAFTLLSPVVSGIVNTNTATVLISLPNGTAVTTLQPLIPASDKATVSPASGVPQDFTSPVVYTVRAEDGSTKQYSVTVEVATLDSKKLLSFGVQGGLAGGVDEATHTAWASVPFSTKLTNLVSCFQHIRFLCHSWSNTYREWDHRG